MKFSLFSISLFVVLCLTIPGRLDAEVFILESGGHIEGLLLNPDQSPRTTYEIATKQGGRITIEAARVTKVIQPDLVDRKPQESPKADESDSSEVTTQEEIMKRRGYRRYKGRWRSEQEIKSMERSEQQDKAVRGWYARVKRWSGWLGGSKTEEAQKAIAQINDPLAVAALADALNTDRRRAAQVIYIEALFRLGTPDATKALAINALENPDGEIRLSCLDFLKKRKDPAVIDYFASQLRHKNNVMVNRAAVALKIMDDASALPALVDALVTVHKKKVTSGSSGQTSAAFSNRGAGGMTMGSTTRIYDISVRNRDVLDALIAITDGVNFDFDLQAWRYWLESQKPRRRLDARRD